MYCFRDTASYLSKFANFDLPHLHLAPPLGVTRFEFQKDFPQQNTSVPGLSCDIICIILRLAVLVELRLVTSQTPQSTGRMAIKDFITKAKAKRNFTPPFAVGHGPTPNIVPLPQYVKQSNTQHSWTSDRGIPVIVLCVLELAGGVAESFRNVSTRSLYCMPAVRRLHVNLEMVPAQTTRHVIQIQTSSNHASSLMLHAPTHTQY